MAKPAKPSLVVPDQFRRYLGQIRQWIDGFEAGGGKGPANADVLRQIQIWLEDYKKAERS